MNNRKSEPKQLSSAEEKISRILRRARLKNNYSIGDLYKITKIKPEYLKDLEEGAFDKLPGSFYIRAFIKNYADNVGLNGEELLRRFNSQLPDFQDPEYINRVSNDHLLANVERQASRNRHSMMRRYIPFLSVIIIVILVLISVWAIASHYHNSLETNSNSYSTRISGAPLSSSRNRKRRRHKKRSKVKVIRRSANAARLNYKIIFHRKAIRMTLTSVQPKKIMIKMNGKSPRTFKLRAKQVKAVKVPKDVRRVSLRSDNANGLKIHLNHKPLKLSRNSSIRLINLSLKNE